MNLDESEVTPLKSTLLEETPELADLVHIYIERLPNIIGNIEQAYTDQDWPELKKLTHDLRSTGGSYGYMVLSEYAAKITNHDYSKPDISMLRQWINEIKHTGKRVILGREVFDQP